MSDLISVLQFLWNLGSGYILFALSFMFSMGILLFIRDLVTRRR